MDASNNEEDSSAVFDKVGASKITSMKKLARIEFEQRQKNN